MATKVGTAYVDVVANFKPLNGQMSRLNTVSARLSASFRRSMAGVSRDAASARRPVARLAVEVAGIGPASRASARQATVGLGEMEAAYRRNLGVVRLLAEEQRALSRSQSSFGSGFVSGRVPAGGRPASITPAELARILLPPAKTSPKPTSSGKEEADLLSKGIDIVIGAGVSAIEDGALKGASLKNPSSLLKVGKTFAKMGIRRVPVAAAVVEGTELAQDVIQGDWDAIKERARDSVMMTMGIPQFGPLHSLGEKAFSGVEDLIGISGGDDDGDKGKVALQKRLATSAKELVKAYRGQRTAGAAVAQSGAVMTRAHRRAEHAGRDVLKAERQLSRARKRFGGDSAQAARAERTLSNALGRQARETQKAQRATRLHGVELRAAKNILKGTTLEGRHRLILLQKEDRQLHVRLRTAQQNNRGWKVESNLMSQIRKNQVDVRATQTALNQTYKEAGQQVGPKYAKFLRNASGELLRVGKQARSAAKEVKVPSGVFKTFGETGERGAGRAKTGFDRLGRTINLFGKDAKTQVGKASSAMRNFNTTTTRSIGDVEAQTNSAFVTIGLAGPFQKRQRGGAIVPGSGSGDTFATSLPTGSFVLNRRATSAFGFRRGGNVPVMLEPGERVFLPDEVRHVGRGRLQGMNAAVPRFQGGGDVGGSVKMVLPQILGPDPLRSLGQKAVTSLFDAVVKLIRREAGSRTYEAVVKEAQRIDALKLRYVWGGGHQSTPAPANGPFDCSGAVSRLLQGSGFPIDTMVSSGFESFGSPGRGKVSVLANPEHVYAVIGGRAWGTSEENPGGGAGWIGGYTYRPGFTERHADVLSLNVVRGARGKGQAAKKGYAAGGLVGAGIQRLSGDGGKKKFWAGTSIDKIYPRSDGASGETIPFYVAAALGEWAGLPGKTMAQIGKSENRLHPGTDVSDPAPEDPAARGWGWLAINSAYSNVTSAEMRNPILNVLQAKKISDENGGPSKSIWHADEFVTGYDLHYTKHDPLTIARHLGASGGEAEGGEKVKRTSFGPLPKDERRCRDELKKLEGKGGLLHEYRVAVKEAKGKTRSALEANVRAVETRIRELRRQIRMLRLKKATNKLTRRLTKGMKRITGEELGIEDKQRVYEKASQDAEQVVELEPDEPGTISFDWIEKEFEPYIKEHEGPAFEKVLGAERGWRNRILEAQTSVGGMERGWDGSIQALNKSIPNLDDEIDGDNKRIKKLRALIHNHPNAEKHPSWVQERDQLLRALPAKHDRLGGMRGRRKQFVEALDEAKGSWDPWRGTGSFEDSLIQVQGIQYPGLHEILDKLPAKPSEGSFDGAIRETQRQIEGLQLKVDQAKEGASQNKSESDAERAELFEGIAREEQERNAILEAQRPVLEGWDKLRQGVFAGLPKFHAGGQVPGPPQREVPIMARGGELVFTPEQMQAMSDAGGRDGSSMVIEQLVIHPDGRATVQSGGRAFDADVKRVVRGMQGTGRRVPGVFSTRP